MRLAILAAWLAVIAVGAPEAAAQNLIRNPSAETVDAVGRPVGWAHYENTPDEWGTTDKEFHSGRCCAFLRVVDFGDDDYATTGMAVGETDGYTAPNGLPVKPNTRYHISFYLAGYGFKRPITVAPWGFKTDGSGRDRDFAGVDVLPAPEWKRYNGTFTTKAKTQRVVLMFFVYGLHDRDVDEGATFFVDDVYVGTSEPPVPTAAMGRAKIALPAQAPEIKGDGYSPLKAGTVRIWDANRKYPMKHYDMRAWENRANWFQVPYGATNHLFRGDGVLESENFWISLHSSPHDAVFLYAKTDAQAAPGRHNELYRVFDTPTGLRNYGSGSQSCRILKNTPEEILVESESITYERGGFKTTVTTRYRLRGGKPWVEIQPVSQADEQGMHGESRFVLAPEANEDGRDFVEDSLRRSGDYICRVPNKSKMLLDLIMDDDTIWVLTCPKVPEVTKLDWPGTRFYAENAPGGWHAGWSRIGEGDCDRVWTAPFVIFAGQPVYIGVLRIGYWHYQRVGQDVAKGQTVTLNWRVAYERQIVSSPFKPACPWRPTYPGKWRLVACMDGRYYTVPITITTEQTSSSSLIFDSPATGWLEYVLFYLYDRTEETPENLWTPADIYRQAVQQNRG